MWTPENRARYDRSMLRYPSDLTDKEWSLIEPLIPPAKRGGNRRTVVMRVMRKIAKAGAMLLAYPIVIKRFEMLERREVKQHHDEQHLGARQLAGALLFRL